MAPMIITIKTITAINAPKRVFPISSNKANKISFVCSNPKTIKQNNIDILHLQEADIQEDTFTNCPFICSSFDTIPNNSPNGYGTASLIKSELPVSNVRLDSLGRGIIFDIAPLS